MSSIWDLFHEYNLPLLGIPIANFLGFVPHVYSIYLSTGGKLTLWQNGNSRSPRHLQSIQKRLTPCQYARFERARGAHQNSLEIFPLFTSAVLSGIIISYVAHSKSAPPVQGINALSAVELSDFVKHFCLSRALYNFFYITITNDKLAILRSAVWAYGMYLCYRTLLNSALTLARLP